MKMFIKTIFFTLILILVSNQLISQPDFASNFIFEAIDGEKVVLSDILKQRKAILLFWTTWCPYCRKELSRMNKFYTENKEKVQVVGIDIQENKSRVEKFIRDMKISLPIVIDSDGNIARTYQVIGIPTIIVIDIDSKIIYFGYSTQNMLDNLNF